jgi:hypothetical protein
MVPVGILKNRWELDRFTEFASTAHNRPNVPVDDER